MDTRKLRDMMALMAGVKQQSGIEDVVRLAGLAQQQQQLDQGMPLRLAELGVRAQDAASVDRARQDRTALERDQLAQAAELAEAARTQEMIKLAQMNAMKGAELDQMAPVREAMARYYGSGADFRDIEAMSKEQLMQWLQNMQQGGAPEQGTRVSPQQQEAFQGILQNR